MILTSLLRKNLPPDMLARVAEIVHHMQKRQYQKANDSYLRLSIGNAPWPIGVTMVGYADAAFAMQSEINKSTASTNVQPGKKYPRIKLPMF